MAEMRERRIEINKPEQGRPLWHRPWFLLALYLLFLASSFYVFTLPESGVREIPYSQFMAYLEEGKVREALVTDEWISGELAEEDPATGQPVRFITVPPTDQELARQLREHGVTFKVRRLSDDFSRFFWTWVLPFGLLFLLWGWMLRRAGAAGQDFLRIGRRIRIHPDTLPKVTFDDVAGVDEAKEELKEVVEFLKDPARIQALGGRPPKGVLLVGPPGTGKTLLARAVAGEAGVPFFSLSGSEFVEMFAGVGAARVRDLFQQARQKAPCIVFIDELDAIGRTRTVGPAIGGHDEREQTLNQLLVEMDGFDPSAGVVVMAATNRPEILDKALLRAGRFDRRILVDKPDLEGRLAILRVHTRKVKLAEDVDLRVVAQRTPGFVGADLANIVNEAAIMAVRRGHRAVTMADFEAAIDRVIAGPEKKSTALTPEEKRRVAVHEAGHTLVALSVPTGEPVHKVSIIPRGIGALGFTLQLPVRERFLSTEQELRDQLAVLLGGRAAEALLLGSVSSGAQNDLEKASEIARAMVTRLGMSGRLGPLTYGRRQEAQFLGGPAYEERNYSEETARLIDAEVRALVEAEARRVERILQERRQDLEELAALLLEREVIGGEELRPFDRRQAAGRAVAGKRVDAAAPGG